MRRDLTTISISTSLSILIISRPNYLIFGIPFHLQGSMPCNQAVSNQILTVYQTQQPEILTVYQTQQSEILTVYQTHDSINSQQPTLTPVDTILKAVDDLTHALKESRNTKGILQIEGLLKMDELFNKQLTSTAKTTEPPQEIQPSPRMTFAKLSKPPQEIPTSRVAIKKATIDKAMSNDIPNYTPRELGAKLNHLICLAANNRARIQKSPPDEPTPPKPQQKSTTDTRQRDRRVPQLLTTDTRPQAQRNMGTISRQ